MGKRTAKQMRGKRRAILSDTEGPGMLGIQEEVGDWDW